MSEGRKKVLVVDDEDDILTYLTTLLEDNGYDTMIARDGEQALAKVQDDRPDLITLDISMPERSGVGFYRDLKKSEEWNSIPVLMITGVTGGFDKYIQSRRQVPPPEGFLAKPIDKDKFLELVAELTG
jgi:CheY-like chemotaxis protein